MSYSYNASLSQDKYRYVGPIPYNNFIITLYQLCDNQQSNFICNYMNIVYIYIYYMKYSRINWFI